MSLRKKSIYLANIIRGTLEKALPSKDLGADRSVGFLSLLQPRSGGWGKKLTHPNFRIAWQVFRLMQPRVQSKAWEDWLERGLPVRHPGSLEFSQHASLPSDEQLHPALSPYLSK